MTTSQELALRLIELFKQDVRQSKKLVDLLTEVFKADGLGKNEAAIEAERISPSVLGVLGRMREQNLPFYFGSRDSMLLVGKGRTRPSDTDETTRARRTFVYVDDLWDAILAESDFAFECLCAICLKMSGAEDAQASCSSDDGGIDIFGRILIGRHTPNIDTKLLETNILSSKRILFLGQAKKYSKHSKIGRPDLQKFSQAVTDCLNQYEGNSLPPSHGVPRNYYMKRELCIPIFMTTSDFSNKAEAAALSYDMMIITGREIAEFLCSREVGFVRDGTDYRFDKDLFHAWLMNESKSVKREYGSAN